jgi:hypothetical protein
LGIIKRGWLQPKEALMPLYARPGNEAHAGAPFQISPKLVTVMAPLTSKKLSQFQRHLLKNNQLMNHVPVLEGDGNDG